MRECDARLLERVESESITEERPYEHQAEHYFCDPTVCIEAAYLILEEENAELCWEMRME